MQAVLTVLGIVLFGAALGRRVLRLCRVRFELRSEEVAFATGLGLGIFSLVIMVFGLMGQLTSEPTRTALLAVIALLLPDAVMLLADMARAGRKPRPPRPLIQQVLAAAVVISLAAGAVSALAPPTSWDATTSHLKVPLRFLATGDIRRLDDLSSNAPLNTVMLFIPAMALGGDAAPALLHLAFLAVGGLALFAMASRTISRTGAWTTLAAYCLMPVAAMLGPEAVTDYAVVAYVALAFVAFARWWGEERRIWLVLAGVYLGFAAGTKYTGLHAIAIFALAIAIKTLVGSGRRRALLSHAVSALVLAVALASPWYMRNFVETGNPVYPILTNVFRTRHLTAEWTGPFHQTLVPRGYPSDVANLALFPVNWTFGFSRGVRGGPVAEAVMYSPGPFLLAFVPLILLLRPVRGWAAMAVALALLGCALIVPMHPSPRHVLPFVAPCALVVGWAFERLSGRGWVRDGLCVVATLMAALLLVPFVGRAATRVRVVVGLDTRADYLASVDDVYPMARHAAAVLPEDAKVLYVGERVYYFLERGLDVTMAMPRRQAVVDFRTFEDSSDLLARVRELGFTHIVVNEAVLTRRAPFAIDLFHPLEGRGLTRLANKKHLVLYEVQPGG